jgi:DNA-binding NarL/FixJ family response regulator
LISRKSEISVVIADDHPIVRDGLRRSFKRKT